MLYGTGRLSDVARRRCSRSSTTSAAPTASVGSISSAITVSVLLSSILSAFTGPAVGKYGPRPVIALGALLMSSGIFFTGQVREPWHVFAAFSLSGLGFSCISVTTLSATLSPWFERQQGRAISTAMLGASIGGMTSTPLLVFAISRVGLEQAMIWSAAAALLVILPLAIFVLRKSPAEMGLHPDGEPPAAKSDEKPARVWSRKDALRTTAFASVVIAFAGIAFWLLFKPGKSDIYGDVSGADVATASAH